LLLETKSESREITIPLFDPALLVAVKGIIESPINHFVHPRSQLLEELVKGQSLVSIANGFVGKCRFPGAMRSELERTYDTLQASMFKASVAYASGKFDFETFKGINAQIGSNLVSFAASRGHLIHLGAPTSKTTTTIFVGNYNPTEELFKQIDKRLVNQAMLESGNCGGKDGACFYHYVLEQVEEFMEEAGYPLTQAQKELTLDEMAVFDIHESVFGNKASIKDFDDRDAAQEQCLSAYSDAVGMKTQNTRHLSFMNKVIAQVAASVT
jgi:hypothetical protein